MNTKILCVCEGGNVRSVACAYLFKYQIGYDALAASWKRNSLGTLMMLYNWADRIIIMQPEFREKVIPTCYHKITVYDVGPDRWGSALHPDLLEIIETYMGHDSLLNYGKRGQPQ